MRIIVTEILLGCFVIGALLLYWHHCAEIGRLKKSIAEMAAEIADTTGRVVNLEAATSTLLKSEKRNGRTA